MQWLMTKPIYSTLSLVKPDNLEMAKPSMKIHLKNKFPNILLSLSPPQYILGTIYAEHIEASQTLSFCVHFDALFLLKTAYLKTAYCRRTRTISFCNKISSC